MTENNPFNNSPLVIAHPPVDSVDPEYGWEVARAQRAMVLAFILQLGASVPQVGWLLYLCGVVLSYWAVYNLGDALQTHEEGFSTGGGGKWLVVLWIPYVGAIALLMLNRKATRLLRDAGYSVGLLGARR